MKELNGLELAGFIKERQARQVRGLRQAFGVAPKLAIVQTIDNPVIDKYVALKKRYGTDILIDVDHRKVTQSEALQVVESLNADDSVHGIIIQLPLADPEQTEILVDAVAPEKDVDGLGKNAVLDPATPMAINWLLAGYNVELRGKKIVIVGHGRLVGGPLAKMWKDSNLDVTTLDSKVKDIKPYIQESDIIVTATGVPRLITSDMLRPDVVVVDAATASENGKLVGDVSEDVRLRHDLTITPVKGGVGPLTVTALFENVLRAARATAQED